MKKFGFTLAEVLITLLIIGVVATLTAPALINNVGDAKVGPQLAKFVNSFENAVQNVFLDESINSLEEYGLSTGAEFHNALAKHLIMSNLTGTKKFELRTGTGSNVGTPNSDQVWQTKDGYILLFWVDGNYQSGGSYMSGKYGANDHGAYSDSEMVILIDIGGEKGQHRAGKEVYAFMLDRKGMLVPYGSKTHKWLMDGKSIKTCSRNSTNVWENLACTGEIADNGYKKSSK